MKAKIRSLVLLFATLVAAVAAASPAHAASAGQALFVQTNAPTGNSIDVFARNADGTLTFRHAYPTGGLGGRESGAGSDPLASQGSLLLIPGAGLLVAVNAGSNTISVFAVDGTALRLAQVLPSGGLFPTGVAVRGDLVYVLDAGGPGAISGYRAAGGMLHPIAGSTRALGLTNANPPFFLSSPAEVGFTPDGAHIVVTTKTNGTVEVFSVGPDGRPSAGPVVNAEAGVPFAFGFEASGRMILNFAGTSSLQAFTVNASGTIAPAGAAVSDGQAAACWITSASGFDYVSNTGSGDVSQFAVSGANVTLVNPLAANGISGAIDSASAGGFLYVQAGLEGTVHAYSIGAGGALSPLQVATVPNGGSQEGIAAA